MGVNVPGKGNSGKGNSGGDGLDRIGWNEKNCRPRSGDLQAEGNILMIYYGRFPASRHWSFQ